MTEADRRYWQSEKGRATRARHDASAKKKESRRKYNQTVKRKVAWRAYDAKRKGHGELDVASVPDTMSTVCDICGSAPTKHSLHLDHDHETGKFRGWLCRNCNVGIGFAKDSVETLQKWIDYLSRYVVE